ncbi:ferrochelatase [Geomonas sp. Red69]|uniref:Ferrochelatase n=1 Tax=Geomonas diazotrophica TaxID=2843197 RepID=A0ABX8JPR6_9BACT|nr:MULTISPECIES: ferrochelatase [Geomonas]MBU5638749.1 ferrochelatase [Geomonas diazotrophica]QWV97410.1 ferrochelatase [Geomonas nitrogeniifigens]QXE86568.1 ferrochelatase [Geomonas nitrogeniifigens]
MSDKTALLLLQMGGPDSLDAVHPFLMNLFTDRDIIKIGPAFLQPFIARRIVNKRAPKVEEYYRQIGGKSPIRELTEAQGAGLQALLGERFRSFVAMRYSRPSTIDALAAIKREGIKRVVALSLYPHYSKATTGSSVNELQRVLKESKADFEITYIDRFYNHPLYIKALAGKVIRGLQAFPDRKDVEIVFSAHSLPQSFIDEGDPYLAHIQETVRLVMEQVGEASHLLCFQSKASKVKWLEPSTEATLERLAKEGKENLLMVPLSFVSDHIETLYEIDIQYAEEAKAHGIKRFVRTESLNSDPMFLDCLADLVRTTVKA